MTGTTRSPEPFSVAAGGATLAALRWEGDAGTPILAVHATGFCKELWTPLVEAELVGWPVIAPDQRGHGDSTPISVPFDWWDLGRDCVAILAATEWAGGIGVGHSSGAAAVVMVELLRPGTFASLVLIEPIIFPGPPYFRAEENPMSARAAVRRARFGSAQEAFASYHGRGPFARWNEVVLRAYTDSGFAWDADGGWGLKCAPAQEAEFYKGATLHALWSRLGDITCPVLLIGGEDSTSHSEAFLDSQAARFRSADVEIVGGATHFVPMEKPDAVGRSIRRVAALVDGPSR